MAGARDGFDFAAGRIHVIDIGLKTSDALLEGWFRFRFFRGILRESGVC
jgi:hypothetical protein